MSPTAHFFTKGDRSVPSSKYRAFEVADRLNRTGSGYSGRCHVAKTGAAVPAFKSPGGFATELSELRHVRRQVRSCREGDVLVCQRTIYKRLRGLYLMRKRADFPLVFDFDDAVFLHHPAMTRWFLERADVVTAGNSFLKQYAEEYADSAYYLPTGIPDDPYGAVDYDVTVGDGQFRVGWVGNAAAHRENLHMFADVLSEIGYDHDDLAVHLVGVRDTPEVKARFERLPVQAEFTDWIPSEEYTQRAPTVMTSFDAGVMPLTETFWNRGKSALKLLEYMACGVPAIASPVGENAEIVDDGRNGFLASTADEWSRAITALAEPETNEEVARAGRETVRADYTLSAVTTKLTEILDAEFGETA